VNAGSGRGKLGGTEWDSKQTKFGKASEFLKTHEWPEYLRFLLFKK
jgi:hypothetical protein